MREIQFRDAQANLSAFVDEAVQGNPSLIVRHGTPQAVIVGINEWEQLSRVSSFGYLLMAAPEANLPERARSPGNPVDL